jgi:hypothetical protein
VNEDVNIPKLVLTVSFVWSNSSYICHNHFIMENNTTLYKIL